MKTGLFGALAVTMIASLMTTGCDGTENEGSSDEEVIIDSNMTLEEALEGLNPECPPAVRARQVLLEVAYYSFDGKQHRGQLVLDERLSDDLRQVFDTILDEKFPVQSVIPVSEFGWDDETSMQANNTSSFNYRFIAGSTTLSEHAKGWAIDVNPKINPYISSDGTNVQPAGATYDPDKPGTLTGDHPVVLKFKELGWGWGGDWHDQNPASPWDYQHFDKDPTL